MSGGHWSYMSEELAERGAQSLEVWRLMAALEVELDRGICADHCRRCAEARVAPAVIAFMDSRCRDASSAMAIARDRKQNLCRSCQDRGRVR